MKAFLKETAIALGVALVIYIGLHFTVEQIYVQQTSMIPTLEEGQRMFVSKTAYLAHGPERGDIIIFKPPQNPQGTPLIKRVIGLPGETIEINMGQIIINGSALSEPYIKTPPQYVLAPLKVPEEHYFVLGDNRNVSNDSHTGWTVPESDILGKAWLSIWPPQKWGLAPNYAYASQ